MLKSIKLYCFTFLLLITLFSCKFNAPIQGQGVAALQGEWVQDSVAMQNNLVSYSLHRFRFSCDSFFVQLHTFSKVSAGIDSCMQSGEWTEQAIGTYQLKNDTLLLKGFFATDDYRIKEDGCLRKGIYEEAFVIRHESDSSLNMNSLFGTIPLNLRLKERTDCVPKPI